MTIWMSEELRTIPALLREGAEDVPDKTALYIGDEPLTYEQLITRSTQAAAGLHSLGVRAGDAVATLTSNSVEQVLTMFGATLLGAIYTPINSDYKGEFLRHQLATSQAPAVLVDDDLLPQIDRVAGELPDLKHVLTRGDVAGFPPARRAGGSYTMHAAGDVLSHADARLPAEASPRGGDVAAVIFTAGTTGPSKGVAMSHNYLCRSARDSFELRGCTRDSVTYAALPLFHLAALSVLIFSPLTGHATGALDNRFSPNNYWDRVKKFQADHTILLGPMIPMLWNRPESEDDADNSLQVAFVAPMPPAIHRAFEERFGVTVLQSYSQSEAYPLVIAPLSAPSPPGYSGKPNPLFTIKLFDDDDREVPAGTVGEVCVRPNAPHVMFEGYFRNPAGTAAVWRDGWLHTGDLGVFDNEGNFAFADRKKDYLRRRGENISSFEVEHALSLHPRVAEVAVVAAPSELTEDDVAACVVLAPDAGQFDPREFLDYCCDNVPYFAVPRYVWVLPELPRNPVGRVQKYKLRETLSTLPEPIDGLWDSAAHGYVVKRRKRPA